MSGASFKSCLSPAVEQLTTSFWNWRINDLPEFGSFVGIHTQDDKLDDMSLSAHRARYEKCKEFLEQAKAVECGLTEHSDIVNIKALKAELETYITGYPFKGFLIPISTMEGIHMDLERLISWMSLETLSDYKKLLSRYKLLPQKLIQTEELMREGMSQGLVQHAVCMKDVASSLGRFVVTEATESPLWKPFANLPAEITEEESSTLKETAKNLIIEEISPAFKRLQQFVASEYKTRPDTGISSLPDGDSLYKQLLRFHTLTDYSAEEIHQIGINEIQRIEGEMAKMIKELGHNMTVQEFSSMIRNDPKFYFASAEELLLAFEELAKKIPPRMLDLFAEIPNLDLKIEGDPSPNKSGTEAFYEAGSYDGSRDGVFQVSTYHFDKLAKYKMMTLTLHEGNPGHHYHRSYCRSSPTMPFFRRVMEDRNYCHAPSRFPINTAYGEGWALYAESLGFDMGLYDDPYDRYGHYSAEIFRACRLVVDTGLHAFGWTREQAIEYIFHHSAVSRTQIEKEVDRYIMIPGQALGYKIGQMKISELRKKAQQELGDKFNIKTFHMIVMESTGPLSLLEEEIDKWIAGEIYQ